LQHCKKKNIPLYGTFLDGKNIYTDTLTPNGLIIMGNEGKGISTELQPLISHRLFIPNFPINAKTSESLNVAVATAITCSEFRRRMF
ncbi:MAG TPA: TrmH family RNA methyltransferase, partial [Paludibacteraceae bacterium]|nr:TrmH family RNA methyltransferase [Paludibacteraceae bacterium]